MDVEEMDTHVIAGGNGGIGLEVAREVMAAGNRVIVLGRDKEKGASALAALKGKEGQAVFLAVDLSTHKGVREAASQIDAITDRIDGILHSAAVFETRDIRTADNLPLFFALSFLSRYHLTQLLIPKLLQAEHPRIAMFTASLKETPKLYPERFREFESFNFMNMVMQVNGACMYYADYLMQSHPKIFAASVSPGFVLTDLFRNAPWYLRLYVALVGPFKANTLQVGAHNAAQILLRGEGKHALNWYKPGDFETFSQIKVDREVQKEVIAAAEKLIGW